MLIGRDEECAEIDRLLSATANGGGDALAILGSAGMGKTALLTYATNNARDLHVVWARGYVGESDISYAGLSQILNPLLEWLPELSSPQQAAIHAALTIGFSNQTETLALYSGTLALLSAAAASRALLVVVDDAHWIDAASMKALLFAQRRLTHDAVLILLGLRAEHEMVDVIEGIRRLNLQGITPECVAEVLRALNLPATDQVVKWLAEATGGNPLAIRDLPLYLSARSIAAYAAEAQAVPIGPALQTAYMHALSEVSDRGWRALLIAATMDDHEIEHVVKALEFAHLDLDDLQESEDAGLTNAVHGFLHIHHPLVRSAILQRATPSDRRHAHAAAAYGLTGSAHIRDQQSRIWHLAAASLSADEDIARLLEELGSSAMIRGDCGGAYSSYLRSSELSANEQGRVRRRLLAADAALLAGMSGDCSEILDDLDRDSRDQELRPRLEHLRGRLILASGEPLAAAIKMQAAAEQCRSSDPQQSMQLCMDATVAAAFAGEVMAAYRSACSVKEIASQLASGLEPLGDLVVGAVLAMRGDGLAARPMLDRCHAALAQRGSAIDNPQLRVYLAVSYSFIDCPETARELFRSAIVDARRTGALGVLPFALTHRAVVDYRSGSWSAALAGVTEGLAFVTDTGRSSERPNALAVMAMIQASRGDESARLSASEAIQLSSMIGARFIEAQGYSMLGLLELGTGHPDRAIEPLERCGLIATELGLLELSHLQWAAELVEAFVRSGHPDSSSLPLTTMQNACHSNALAINRALLARCCGLLDVDGAWEEHFHVALELHRSHPTRPFEEARTRLCFGERLRRERRRKSATVQLAAAWETFSMLGAVPWTRRAAVELEAIGASAVGPVTQKLDLLTPQEYQVAAAVVSGATNKEAAASLFLSPKTVEFHLSAVYRRLGVKSRRELVAEFGEAFSATV